MKLNLIQLATAAAAVAASAAAAESTSAVDIIKMIAPTSVSCPADAPDCRTAEQLSPLLVRSMAAYNILTTPELAALLALMAFETADFRYKRNMYPGVPGQGTSNMQQAKFNLLYAKSLDGVKDKVADIQTVDGLSADKLNYILSLVTPDEYNFGSGPWFLTMQCPPTVRSTLQKTPDAGFAAYMACVGVQVGDDRKAYWTRAKKAFGLP